MKKILLTLITVFALFTAEAQVIFNETFDGISGPTAGGAGTYTFPSGWTFANVDNRTPNAAVAYVNEAWERREDFSFNVADSCAFSTSWYSPAGASDDWMVTPAIGPLPANVVLSWNAVTYDASYPDGYQVRIMTTAPTGTTGNIGNLVTASTQLFSTAAENTTWINRTVNLNAYAGQTVYIAFRNNSNDKFLLLIDDIKLEVQVQNEANLVSLDTVPEYTIIPKSQVYSMPTLATVTNSGINTLTNVALKLNVYDGANNQIYTATGTPTASLAAAASAQLSAGNYQIPSTPDYYTFEYIVIHSVADDNPLNDTLYSGVLVDDSTYARDNGTVVGGLGIGAGNGGYLGQSFEVLNNAALSSVGFYATSGYTGEKAACVLWSTTNGTPNAIIASTDTMLYPDDSARYYTLNMAGGPYSLSPGTYVITAVEFDSTLQLGQTADIFTLGSTWVNWPTSPAGGWANNEYFGASFSKAYVLRLNLNPDCSSFNISASATNTSCANGTDGTATVTPMGGSPSYSYFWSTNDTTQSISNLAAGAYVVTVTDSVGCVKMDTVTVTSPTAISIALTSTPATCATCADGTASGTASGGTPAYSYSWNTTPAQTTATATGLLPGVYMLCVVDMNGCTKCDTITVNFSTSIQDIVSAKTTIYPNPGKDAFTVTIPEEFGTQTQIIVTNYLGEIVVKRMINSNGKKEIDLSELATGNYTVMFTNENYTVNKTLTIIK